MRALAALHPFATKSGPHVRICRDPARCHAELRKSRSSLNAVKMCTWTLLRTSPFPSYVSRSDGSWMPSKSELGEELRLPVDYYWDVMAEDAHTIHEKPKPTFGQVSDDAASLREFLAQPADEYVVIQAEGARFRGLLRAIEYVYLNQDLLRDPATGEKAASGGAPRRRRRWRGLRPWS